MLQLAIYILKDISPSGHQTKGLLNPALIQLVIPTTFDFSIYKILPPPPGPKTTAKLLVTPSSSVRREGRKFLPLYFLHTIHSFVNLYFAVSSFELQPIWNSHELTVSDPSFPLLLFYPQRSVFRKYYKYLWDPNENHQLLLVTQMVFAEETKKCCLDSSSPLFLYLRI